MNAKPGLAALVTALISGCAGSPTLDTSVFPPQPVYSASSASPPVAADTKVAK